MDGVLVDSHAVHRTAWRQFFQTLGREVSEPELNFILDGRKRSDILRHFLGRCSDLELEELGRRKDNIFQEIRLEASPVPGVVPMVRELRRNGTALAVATCASRRRAVATLTELGLIGCFPVIVAGEDVVLGKPDAAIYRLACTRIALEPESLLAVEDAISGVRSATGAGLRCIGVALHETCESLFGAGAIHVVRDFQSVSAHDLECILAAREPGKLGAAAAGT